MDKEVNDKYYEKLIIEKSTYYAEILDILEIVKRFIVKEQRLVVGGMSIDMALKLKNHPGIYDDDTLPDYDFYSSEHHKDAYRIAEYISSAGYSGISVINASHPSTMRVRINFIAVADVTFIPKIILENIPFIRYKGFRVIHPHVQMIDQHRSLSYLYENAPRENVLSGRPKKDMKRYDLLYEYYPLRVLNINSKSIMLRDAKIPIELLENQCVSGFFALVYWINKAKSMGFKSRNSYGTYTIDDKFIKYSIPVDSHGITIYSDDVHELYQTIVKIYKPKEKRYYNRFLDKLPQKIVLDNQWELLDNHHKISATKEIGNIYIANLQLVMLYLLTNYILLMKIKNIKRGYSFYSGYLECRNLVEWASGKYYTSETDKRAAFATFLPTADCYGSRNISDSYIVAKHNFDIKNKTINENTRYMYMQPYHLYDRDLGNHRAPALHYKFNPKRSKVFDLDGEQVDKF